jgi:hypothetical protein
MFALIDQIPQQHEVTMAKMLDVFAEKIILFENEENKRT